MEELMEMRALLEAGRLPEAMLLLDELDEMAKDDKINKIGSHLKILLLHLIKQAAEQRSTSSWEVSIANAVDAIQASNKRRKAGGFYLTTDELCEAITEAYRPALRLASLESFKGELSPKELGQLVNATAVQDQALALLLAPTSPL